MGIVWSQMSRLIHIPWSLKLFLENVMLGCCKKNFWPRVRVNRRWIRKMSLSSVVFVLSSVCEKVSSNHLWFQSPFPLYSAVIPNLTSLPFPLLPWLDHFSLQFYLHNHQTCFIIFFNFLVFKFYSQRQIWLFCSKIIYFWGASVWKHSIVRSFPYLIIPVPHC